MEPNRWTIDDDGDLRRGERLPLRSDGTTVRTVFGLLCTDELREVLERGQALAAPAADPLPEGVHRAHGTMTALAEDVVLLGVGWEWFDIDTFRWLPAQGNDARKPHMRAGCVYEVRPAGSRDRPRAARAGARSPWSNARGPAGETERTTGPSAWRLARTDDPAEPVPPVEGT
jgi:hypothetical protein